MTEDDNTLSAIVDVSKKAAANLVTIANIPTENRKIFCTAVTSLIAATQLSLRQQDVFGKVKTFEEIERAVLALLSALRRLTGPELRYLQICLEGAHENYFPNDPNVPSWAAVPAMLYACSPTVNKNPSRRNRKGSVQDWTFQELVRILWMHAAAHGGNLSANCKNNVGSGTMFKALEELRPYFQASPKFIKEVLPAQTIANVVKLARSQFYP